MALSRWLLVALNAVRISADIFKEELLEFILAIVETVVDLRMHHFMRTRLLSTYEYVSFVVRLRSLGMGLHTTLQTEVPGTPTVLLVTRRVFTYYVTSDTDMSLLLPGASTEFDYVSRREYRINLLRPNRVHVKTEVSFEKDLSADATPEYAQASRHNLMSAREMFGVNDLLVALTPES